MCGTMIMNRNESLILLKNTYGCLLLWFVGFAKRNGLDKIITRRVLMCVAGLMALAVIKIQSIFSLIFLSLLFVFLVFLVAITYDSDTSGFTEGVCICFLASAGVYALQGVLYHALGVSGRPGLSFLFFNES
ncbi:hypothetical protein MKW92_038982 [Papaver armeniacum]|nr:hypothetical protein MKW92_038982 [Papaver armeniacum]